MIKFNNVVNLCEILQITYNTNNITYTTPQIKNVLKKMFKSNIIENNPNNILIRLCYNYFLTLKKPIFTYFIKGPHSLTCHFSEKINKIIYIFGEQHNNHIFKQCNKSSDKYVEIDEFLYELIQNTNSFLDVYLEIQPFYEREYNINDITISNYKFDITIFNIFLKLKQCIEPKNRYIKKCELSRIHYLDIRKNSSINPDVKFWMDKNSFIFNPEELIISLKNNEISSFSFIYIQYFHIVKILTQFLNDQRILNHIYPKFENMLKSVFYLFELFYNQSNQDFFNFIYTNIFSNQIKKELKKTYNESDILLYIKNQIKYLLKQKKNNKSTEKLLKHYIDKIYFLTQQYNNPENGHYIVLLKNPNTDNIKNIIKFIKYIYSLIEKFIIINMPFFSISMDIYLLSRLFKKFKTKHPNQPEQPNNVIIYTGQFHSENYRNFLDEQGFNRVNITNQILGIDCVNLGGLNINRMFDIEYVKQFYSK